MANQPLHLITCTARDSHIVNRLYIRNDIAHHAAIEGAMEHVVGELPSLYTQMHIVLYDMSNPGSASTADLLASQVPIGSPITSYLDLGTGTAGTALACSRVLHRAHHTFQLVLVDGLKDMLQFAVLKLQSELPQDAVSQIHAVAGDIRGDFASVRANIHMMRELTSVSLITAQRILLNVRAGLRSQQLRHWADFLSQGGKLIVDVPHPKRRIGYLTVRANRPTYRNIADAETWEECRIYARQLATEANLIITNTMPAQLPGPGQEDGHPAFMSWVTGCKFTTVSDPLSRDELMWFSKRYAQEAAPHYRHQGFSCEPDIAAVITVFECAPVTTVPTATGHTKYDIDELLTGKARRNAIKKAAKAAKAKNVFGEGNQDDGGAGGAGPAA